MELQYQSVESFILYMLFINRPYDGKSEKTTTNCWVKDKFVSTLGKIPACQYEHEFLDAINPLMKE